jgi:hypothetical protein
MTTGAVKGSASNNPEDDDKISFMADDPPHPPPLLQFPLRNEAPAALIYP